MREKYGIILIDTNEITIRVYETDEHEWRMIHYLTKTIIPEDTTTASTAAFAEAIAEFLSDPATQHIAEWRTCARAVQSDIVRDLASATGLTIESLNPMREQELLCKGMFTEFW